MEITVRKQELLDKLLENRAKHRAVFEDAVKGWRQAALDAIAAKEREIREGRLAKEITLSFPAPQDHTRDYDRVIGMLRMHTADEFPLEEHEYAQYVDDDWNWKRRWAKLSSAYAGKSVIDNYGVAYLESLDD